MPQMPQNQSRHYSLRKNNALYQGTTLQAAEKLIRAVGRGFIPGIKTMESAVASRAAEKLDEEGGGGFNPRIGPTESTWASAPEGCFSPFSS